MRACVREEGGKERGRERIWSESGGLDYTVQGWEDRTLPHYLPKRATSLIIFPLQGMPEAVGNAVARSLQRTIHGSYEDVFRATVLPSFERACQEMFRQIDEAFHRGTKECEAMHQYECILRV